ncbi:MAG TPA: OmpA family protein [Polyangia bacterium]|nr:OmpA family protein [Polyangia bacterium]
MFAIAGCAIPQTKMVAVGPTAQMECAADADCGSTQLCVDRSCHNVMSVSACSDMPVHFATNSAAIDTNNRGELNDLAACLRSNRDVRVTVAGNADERGSEDMNEALAARRADAVAGYLQSAGVSSGQMQTVAYGTQDPLCRTHDSSCWKANRRAEITTEGAPAEVKGAARSKTSTDDEAKHDTRIDSTGNGTDNGSPVGK